MNDTTFFALIIGMVVLGAIIIGLMYLPNLFHGFGGTAKSAQKKYSHIQARLTETNDAIARLETKRFITKAGRDRLDRLRRERAEMESTLARLERDETARMKGEK